MTGRSVQPFRFTYNQPEDAYLIVNPNSDEGKGYIEIDTIKKQIRGYNPVHRIYQGWGEPAGYNGYFIIEYQNEIEEYGTFRHDSLFAGQRQIADGTSIGAYLRFKIHSEGPILIKAASSFTDMEGAQKNLDTEIPHWDFDRTRQETELHLGTKALHKLQYRQTTETIRRNFTEHSTVPHSCHVHSMM